MSSLLTDFAAGSTEAGVVLSDLAAEGGQVNTTDPVMALCYGELKSEWPPVEMEPAGDARPRYGNGWGSGWREYANHHSHGNGIGCGGLNGHNGDNYGTPFFHAAHHHGDGYGGFEAHHRDHRVALASDPPRRNG